MGRRANAIEKLIAGSSSGDPMYIGAAAVLAVVNPVILYFRFKKRA